MRSYTPDALGPSIGNTNRIPYWGSPDSSFLQDLYTSKPERGGYSTTLRFRYMIPAVPMSVTIKGLTAEFSTASGIWLGGVDTDIWDLEHSENMTLPVYFDPPRRVLGSRNPQTDLRRGYYVEVEDPLEAQNAEQGSVNDRESELQHSLRHPTVLRRTIQRDVLHLDFSRWNFKDRYCFRRARRNSQNAYLQTKHQGEYHYRKLQRGLHSYTTTGYHGSGSTYRSLLNIHSIQRCSGSLLVSYRRASYA